MREKVAIYPGTFDPVHIGHLDVLEDSSKVFSKVIWAVGTNPVKKPMFSIEQRLEMMRLANSFSNVEVAQFGGLLVNFAKSIGAEFVIRSLRMATDFEYEFQMSLINRQINPNIISVYFPARQKHLHLSSTLIRELILNNELIDGCVPNEIRDFIRRAKEV